MILHASLISDIAHFYPTWTINRLKEGYFDKETDKGVDRYDFKKNKLEKIFFWSKDPLPLIKQYKDLKETRYDFEIISEISLYDKCYEPKIKSKYRIMEDMRKAHTLFGKDKISFCYGPVFTTYNSTKEWHINQFKFLVNELSSIIGKIYIAFEVSTNCKYAHNYNIQKLNNVSQLELFNIFSDISKKYNLEVFKKPETSTLNFDEIDMGDMNTCPANCVYCPGINNKRTTILKNERHVISSSLLIGNLPYDTKINEINLYKKEKIEKKEETLSLLDF